MRCFSQDHVKLLEESSRLLLYDFPLLLRLSQVSGTGEQLQVRGGARSFGAQVG
jgi:hypothetical protein